MKDNTKKYRRSPLSIACYVLAALMLIYVVYTAGSTAGQIGEYYAQYDMKPKLMEYVAYIMQAILAPLINGVIFFMLGYILDEVRKNNRDYYLSDEEIEEAKAAKKEARLAKKAAAGEAAAMKAGNITTAETSVEAEFARSLDEELNKDVQKKAPRKRSGNSQKKSAESKSRQSGQNNQDGQKKQSDNKQAEQKKQKKQADQKKKNPDDAGEKTENEAESKSGKSGSGNRKRSSKKPAADKPKNDVKEAAKAEPKDGESTKAGSSGKGSGNRRRSKKPAADKPKNEADETAEAAETPVTEAKELPKAEAAAAETE